MNCLKSCRKSEVVMKYILELQKGSEDVFAGLAPWASFILKTKFHRRLILNSHMEDEMSGRTTKRNTNLTATQAAVLLAMLPFVAIQKMLRRMIYEKHVCEQDFDDWPVERATRM